MDDRRPGGSILAAILAVAAIGLLAWLFAAVLSNGDPAATGLPWDM